MTLLRKRRSLLIAGTAVGFFVACGTADKSSESTVEPTYVEESAPSDSTGGEGTVNLLFSGGTSASLNNPLLASGVTLTVAEASLAAVKIKAEKEPSAAEVELEDKEKTEEKAAVAKVDAEEGVTSGLAPTGEKERKERQEKLAKAQAKFEEEQEAEVKKLKERDKSTHVAGSHKINLLTGEVTPPIDAIKIADGSYRRFDLKFKRYWSDDETDSLLGKVLYFEGSVDIDGEAVPFKFSYHIATNVRIKSDEAVAVDKDVVNSFAALFDKDKLFKDVDWASAERDETSGVIYIDKNTNKSILKQVHKNFKTNAKMGKDKDADGEVSSTETVGEGVEDTGDDIES